MNNDNGYDYSKDFSIEELHEEKEPKEYISPEEQLRDLGMSQSDFL